MLKKISKRTLIWIIGGIAVLVIGLIGFKYWKARKAALPEGIGSAVQHQQELLVRLDPARALRAAFRPL